MLENKKRLAIVMAGGTGGHIFPGISVAHALMAEGWEVMWLGNPAAMEGKLVPPAGITLLPLTFAGMRGNGFKRILKMPLLLTKAMSQAKQHFNKLQPDVVIGMGGYVAFPGGLMAKLMGIPLVIHEQNSIPGLANKVLARVAKRVLTGFPRVLDGQYVGNPVRHELTTFAQPSERLGERRGPLTLLVVGGSLGAQALNKIVPYAIAKLPPEQRPVVVHQAGEKHLTDLQHAYATANVAGECTSFIHDMSAAYRAADVIICRAGAMTVAEVAATGSAALFVPYPHAVDDHQTANARVLSEQRAAWLIPQSQLSIDRLADWLASMTRHEVIEVAERAYALGQRDATQTIVNSCKEVVG